MKRYIPLYKIGKRYIGMYGDGYVSVLNSLFNTLNKQSNNLGNPPLDADGLYRERESIPKIEKIETRPLIPNSNLMIGSNIGGGGTMGGLLNGIEGKTLYPYVGMLANSLMLLDNKAFKTGKSYAEMLMNEKPEVRDSTYVRFDEMKYNDRSQPLRNQLIQNTNTFNELAGNISGGSATNLLNMYLRNYSNNISQLQQINNQEAGRLDQINMNNVQIRNQQEQINKQYYDANVTANEQNRARARDLNRLGMTTLYQLLEMQRQNRRTAMQDNLKWLSDIQSNNETKERENMILRLLMDKHNKYVTNGK